jgi:hypothetical protein
VRTGEEDGEGGADGEGEGEAEEDEEEGTALPRRAARKRGNAPVWFHARVSSPPSKSSSSEENAASSASVSPGPSSGVVLQDAIAVGAAVVGRLYVGKMRGGLGGGAGGGGARGCVGEAEGERGSGGSMRKSP